jgi:hypothetical protein
MRKVVSTSHNQADILKVVEVSPFNGKAKSQSETHPSDFTSCLCFDRLQKNQQALLQLQYKAGFQKFGQ